MNKKQLEVIQEMQSVSENGVLPSSKIHRGLYYKARRYFDSWDIAAAAAGLKSYSAADLDKTRSLEIKTEFYLERFFIALSIAKRHELKGEEVVDNCMKAAREGLLDQYKLV